MEAGRRGCRGVEESPTMVLKMLLISDVSLEGIGRAWCRISDPLGRWKTG